jgi:hypothetical protein
MVENLSSRSFPREASYGRRLVNLGAQLCSVDGRLLDLDYARSHLPRDLEGGGTVEIPIEITAPTEAGDYQLKFDLVNEGIDWFEKCGSPTTTHPLIVQSAILPAEYRPQRVGWLRRMTARLLAASR